MATVGRSRQRLAGILNAAFAEGLLSEHTHSYRLGMVFGPRLIDQDRVVGDLTLRRARSRRPAPARQAWSALSRSVRATIAAAQSSGAPMLLALDAADGDRLVAGRDPRCDVHLREPTVSRRHAQLTFRDGAWVIQDLGSRNGTTVNGRRVGRMVVHGGDVIGLGGQTIQLD